MDEGKDYKETKVSPWNILRNRYWLFNIIWSILYIPLAIFLILISGIFVFFLSPLGLISLFLGIGFSIFLQVRYTLGWPNRTPLYVPKPFGQTKETVGLLIIILSVIPSSIAFRLLFLFNPLIPLALLPVILSLLSFIFGALILGTWLTLAGLIRYENREGIQIMKKSDKLIALDYDEVTSSKPGNT